MPPSPLRAASLIRDIPDFPQPGILFRDITPVLADPAALREVTDHMTDAARRMRPDVIVGVESRGFLFGVPIALNLGIGFGLIRKVGKLPHDTIQEHYNLEYGTATIEIHADAISPGQRVVIVDDLLATGGTAAAAAALIGRVGGVVAGLCFFIELGFLDGRALLTNNDISALITY